MSVYTCITCRVAFADADLQRGHYKTDWHRYNLKRKVAEMPPVTAENFQQRVLAQRKQVADAEESTATRCSLCSKHFNTSNAYSNHLQSKKHKEAAAKQQRQEEEAKAKQQEKLKEKGLDQTDVNDMVDEKNARNLAISQQTAMAESSRGQGSGSGSPRQAASSSSMEVNDGGTEEDSEEEWEGEALGLEQCLFCSNIAASLEKNVEHMTSAHSFFLPDIEYLVDLEGLISYLGEKVGEGHMCLWCNERGKTFHSTQAVQQHMVDKGHCKLLHEGEALVEYADFYDYSSSYPDDMASGDAEEEEEEEVQPEVLEEAIFQLVLPSGATVGHRSLMRFYRQNLVDRPNHHETAVSKVMAQYKALGWTGSTGTVAQQRARDIAFVQRMKQRRATKLALKANRFQKHFRDDNFGIRH